MVKESSIDFMYRYKFGLPKSAGVFIFCLHFGDHPPTYLQNEKWYFLLRPNHQFISDRYMLHIHLQICNFYALSGEFLLN